MCTPLQNKSSIFLAHFGGKERLHILSASICYMLHIFIIDLFIFSLLFVFYNNFIILIYINYL